MKTIKRFLALLLAVSMTLSFGVIDVYAAPANDLLTSNFTLSINESGTTLTVALDCNKDISAFGSASGVMSVADSDGNDVSEYFTLNSVEKGVLNDVTPNVSLGSWGASITDYVNGDTMVAGTWVTYTYTIAETIPDGTYTFTMTFGEDCMAYPFTEYYSCNGSAVSADYIVGEGGDDETIILPSTEYEIRYDLNSTTDVLAANGAAGADHYMEYGINDEIEATVYLKNKGNETVLQAYDIFLTYDDDYLVFKEITDGDVSGIAAYVSGTEDWNDVAVADEIISHVQLVAKNQNVTLAKDQEISLGTIIFEFAKSAEDAEGAKYGEKYHITLTDGANAANVTNIAVGTVATSYYPTRIVEDLGAEVNTKYTITFDPGEGTGTMADQTIGYGVTANLSANTFTKEGYNFVGWKDANNNDYTDKQIMTGGDTLTSDLTLTAQWEQITYTITFVNEDGTELQSSEVAEGALPVYSGEKPTKEGNAQYSYTFAGWTPEVVVATEATTYTAKYDHVVNKYNITFVNEDGTELQSGEWEYGETPVYSGEEPTKAATIQYSYEFIGWTPDIASVTGTATYTAVFKEIENEYTVTYKNEHGEVIKTVTEPYGTEINLETSTKEGYTFLGWYKGEDLIGEAGVKYVIAGNVELTEKFRANTYTVEYDLNGVAAEQPPSVDAIYDTTVITMPEVSAEGYTFAGWLHGEENYAAGSEQKNLTTEDKGTVILVAKWSQNDYTIREKVDGGEGSVDAENADGTSGNSANKDDKINVTIDPADGYDLVSGSVKYTVVDKDGNPVLDENGQKTEKTINVNKGEDGKYIGEFDMPANHITVSAEFAGIQYTVKFNQNTNDTVSDTVEDIVATYGTDFNLSGDKFTREGYDFLGWSKDAGASTATYAADAAITEDLMVPVVGGENIVTLHAVWQAIKYDVIVAAPEGEGTVSTNAVDNKAIKGDMITVTATPEVGYEVGEIVVTDSEGTAINANEDGTYTMPADHITVNVTFALKYFTVTEGDCEHGSVDADKATAPMEETVTLTATPDEGYELVEFKVKNETTDVETPVAAANNKASFTMPASDVTVTATFQLKELKIEKGDIPNGEASFEDENGDPIETAKMGDKVTVEVAPTPGYEVVDIIVTDSKDADVPVAADGTFTMPGTDVTVDVTFKEIEYTINFELAADEKLVGTANDLDGEIKYTVTTELYLPAAEKGEGDIYTFNGWKVKEPVGNWGDTTYAADQLYKGQHGTVTLVPDWSTGLNIAVEEYKYAPAGYVMLRIATGSSAKVYTFNDEPMFFTSDANYVNFGTETAAGAFVTLIPVAGYAELNDDKTIKSIDENAIIGALGVGDADVVDIARNGLINDDTVVNIADANAVYQMVQVGGGYYSEDHLGIRNRLEADMITVIENTADHRGSLADVHKIVNIINTNA